MIKFRRAHIIGFGILWVGLILFGIGWLERYSHTEGAQAKTPMQWPKASSLQPSVNPTLLVFLHPECSCSEATVSELDKLLAQIPKSVQTYAVFVQPETWSEKDVKGSLWNRTKRIPNVKLIIDKNREEAKLFGAMTSGHTLAYDKIGKLIFSGGITGARGHEGDNEGEETVIKLLNNDKNIRTAQTKIFGCGLFEQ